MFLLKVLKVLSVVEKFARLNMRKSDKKSDARSISGNSFNGTQLKLSKNPQ